MMKFTQLMTFGVGEKSVSFNGREAFAVEGAAFKKALLALGVFAEQENGDLRYSGGVRVPLKNGVASVDERGFLAAEKADFVKYDAACFR